VWLFKTAETLSYDFRTILHFADILGGRDRVNSEMHLEAGIQCVWRCIWRLRSSELRNVLGSPNRVNSEMHLEAVIERVGRYTLRP